VRKTIRLLSGGKRRWISWKSSTPSMTGIFVSDTTQVIAALLESAQRVRAEPFDLRELEHLVIRAIASASTQQS